MRQHRTRAARRILLIEDDASLRRSLAEQLGRHGQFTSLQCENAAAALGCIGRERFDAVLLDVILPDMDGRELCRLIRRAGITAPIILLVGDKDDVDCRMRSEIGATDFIAKPLRLGALLARLRAHLGESVEDEPALLTIGPYSFDPGARLLRDERRRRMVRLTEKETAILQFLYRAGGAVGRDRLLGEIWGYNAEVQTHTLETHVYRLRRKIEHDPARAEILVTEPGGYRLVP